MACGFSYTGNLFFLHWKMYTPRWGWVGDKPGDNIRLMLFTILQCGNYRNPYWAPSQVCVHMDVFIRKPRVENVLCMQSDWKIWQFCIAFKCCERRLYSWSWSTQVLIFCLNGGMEVRLLSESLEAYTANFLENEFITKLYFKNF